MNDLPSETTPPQTPSGGYPVSFGVDYQDRPLNRLTSFFRFLTVIPIAILLASVTGAENTYTAPGDTTVTIGLTGVGILFLPVLLMLLFRRKYPRWWYDWNLELVRFTNRVAVYALLMDDRYPSTDERQAVALDFPYPDAETELSRGLPLVKWLLALPHYVILGFLWLAAFFAVVAAWFAILFTGRYPRGLFGFVEGVLRWHNRVVGYAFLLITDRYPPFSMNP